MFIQDDALIYKQKDNLYYSITKQHGKIILKHLYFQEHYPSIKSFFFVSYEYSTHQLKKSENKNQTSLNIQNMELEYIASLNYIAPTILLFQYIFDYCFEYKIPIQDIFEELLLFFKQDTNDLKSYNFIYLLIKKLFLLEEYQVNNKKIIDINYFKNNIEETLIKLNPTHIIYIKEIINPKSNKFI